MPTHDNLQEAFAGESHEFKSMYPPFVKEAQEEKNKAAERSFRFALAVEEIHHNLYEEALKSVKSNNDLPERKIYVCEVFGNTVYDHAPEKCPMCSASQSTFTEIE